MARIARTLLVLALLAGTAAAFVVTEALKLRPSPITRPRIDKVFSPTCECDRSEASISFVLRNPSRITVSIVSDGHVVRTLERREHHPRGRVFLTWDGRTDGGKRVPDGNYGVRVEFAQGQLRRIDLPNPLAVDTQPPRVVRVRVAPRVISPDGDGHSDRAHVTYTLSERGRAVLYVDGVRVVLSRLSRPVGKLDWDGRRAGRVDLGVHRLTLAARDPAGNLSKPVPVGAVVVRFVKLGRNLIHVAPRRRIQVAVSADHPRLTWQLGKRQGTFRGRVLRVRAPDKPGRYRLRVGYGVFHADATVVVRGKA